VVEDAYGVPETVPADGLFVFIGARPRTDWLPDDLLRDEHGFILTGNDLLEGGGTSTGWSLERPPLMLEASIPGVFVAGDVRHGSVKRVASAVGEGATALQACHAYFESTQPTASAIG
jgi:thioredoxin reductase (NADPH)